MFLCCVRHARKFCGKANGPEKWNSGTVSNDQRCRFLLFVLLAVNAINSGAYIGNVWIRARQMTATVRSPIADENVSSSRMVSPTRVLITDRASLCIRESTAMCEDRWSSLKAGSMCSSFIDSDVKKQTMYIELKFYTLLVNVRLNVVCCSLRLVASTCNIHVYLVCIYQQIGRVDLQPRTSVTVHEIHRSSISVSWQKPSEGHANDWLLRTSVCEHRRGFEKWVLSNPESMQALLLLLHGCWRCVWSQRFEQAENTSWMLHADSDGRKAATLASDIVRLTVQVDNSNRIAMGAQGPDEMDVWIRGQHRCRWVLRFPGCRSRKIVGDANGGSFQLPRHANICSWSK